jgi:predicted dehydrogenase
MTLPIDVTLQLPEPRTPDPHEAPAIRWGVLAPGGIAHAFADAVAVGTASSVVAVGSRSKERAQDFADEFGIARAHGSYEDLVADPDVDAVYVASPHSEHRDHALLAIEAGKPVLVEKAFTRSAAEAREVLAAAEARGLLVMEAMWSRFLPHYDVVRHVVEAGLIGEIVSVQADHGQHLYPDVVLGAPASVTAVGTLTDLGVDASSTVTVTGTGGGHGVLTCTMAAATPCSAVVAGTEARLELSSTFYTPGSSIRLVNRAGDVVDERDGGLPDDVRGFSYEAAEFARCLTSGVRESPLMTHAATLRVMETMDEVRRQTGVVYPGE